MSDPIFISPLWLELLAQRMRAARIDEIEIADSNWINHVKDKINSVPWRDGIDHEFAVIETKLVRKRLNIWERGNSVEEK